MSSISTPHVDFVAPRIDAAKKIVELPRPAGVILALIPLTNPVATAYFKTLLTLMTRNAIILSSAPRRQGLLRRRRAHARRSREVGGRPRRLPSR